MFLMCTFFLLLPVFKVIDYRAGLTVSQLLVFLLKKWLCILLQTNETSYNYLQSICHLCE